MKYIHELIGMPVTDPDKGNGTVAGVELTDDLRRVKGLWIDEGLCGRRYAGARDIQIRSECVFVKDVSGKKGGPKDLFIRARDERGVTAGAVVGALINTDELTVEALQISEGMWKDMARGLSLRREFSVDETAGEVKIGAR